MIISYKCIPLLFAQPCLCLSVSGKLHFEQFRTVTRRHEQTLLHWLPVFPQSCIIGLENRSTG